MIKSFHWNIEDFDTEIFGFTTAKITYIRPDVGKIALDKRVEDLIQELKKQNVKYATYRLSSHLFHLIHALEEHGFLLVDSLVHLQAKIDAELKTFHDKNIVGATKKDLRELKRIIRTMYSNTRFYNDPVIAPKADKVYMKWIENSLAGLAADSVFAYKQNGKIFGFISFDKNGHIPLLGVTEAARGKGIGAALVRSVLNKFQKINIENATTNTSISNIPALGLYQSCGFKIVKAYLTFAWHG